MKKINLLHLSIIMMIFASVLLYAETKENTRSIEDDTEYKQQREEWFNNMHRIKDGLNWKVVDHETRLSKYQIKKHEIEYLLSKNKRNQILSDTAENEVFKGVWIEKGSDNLAGRVHTSDVDFERGLIYLASSGGNIWRGTLDGKEWTCLNNAIKFGDIKTIEVIEYENKNRIIVVSNSPSAVHYSDNEGLTWNKAEGLEKSESWGYMKRGVIHYDNNRFYVLASFFDYDNKEEATGVFVSKDAGETFEIINVFPGSPRIIDIWTTEREEHPVYIVTNQVFGYYNEDDDLTILNSDMDGVYSSSPARIFLKAGNAGDGLMFGLACYDSYARKTYFSFSDDMGESWISTNSLSTSPFMDNSFAMSYSNPDKIFYGGVELYISDNAGFSWEKVNNWAEYYGDIVNKLHADIPGVDIFLQPNGREVVLISTDGGLYKSFDYCETVRNISLKDLNVSQYYSSYTDRHTGSIYAGSQDQGFQRALVDSGKTVSFEQTISGDYGHLTSSDGGIHLWTEYINFVMLYKNLNNPAITISKTWNCEGKGWMWLDPLKAHPEIPEKAYIIGGSNNGGSYVWELLFDGIKINAEKLTYDFNEMHNNVKLTAIGISPIFPEYMYVAGANGEFFLSTDSGESWAQTQGHDGPGSHYLYGSAILPSEKSFGTLYVAGSGYSEDGVMVSQDHGKTFTGISDGLPNTMVFDIAMSEDEKVIFAATQVGAYAYHVDTGKWYDISSLDSPDQVFWSVEYIKETQTARFATYGRGIWDFKVIQYYTDVNEKEIIADDVEINISPNPLNEYSKILINSGKLMNASIKIYDLDGRMIKDIYSGSLNEFNEFDWDGTNIDNLKVTPGVYMLTVSGDGNTWFEKIVVK